MLLRTCANMPLGGWRCSFWLELYLRAEPQGRPTFSITGVSLQLSCPVELCAQLPSLSATMRDYTRGALTIRDAHLRPGGQRFYCGLVICRCLTTCVADLSLQPLQKWSRYYMDQASLPPCPPPAFLWTRLTLTRTYGKPFRIHIRACHGPSPESSSSSPSR